ncbi:MAG: hypothetical protein ACPGQL_06235 [Thermoplasmatota archaeon]
MDSRAVLRAVTLGLLAASLIAIEAPQEETTVAACGFNGTLLDVGTVHVYLECTRPTVDVHPDRRPHPPEDP